MEQKEKFNEIPTITYSKAQIIHYNGNEISFPGIRFRIKKRGLLNLPHAKNALSL